MINETNRMKKIELQNEEYFTYCQDDDLLSSGELTGTYILCKHIKCENFQSVICIDTKEVYLISRVF